MLKTFSEGISTGIEIFQTASQRFIWRGYRKEADILTIPEEYRTTTQQHKVETDPEKIKRIPTIHQTPKQKEILRNLGRGRREEALVREIEAGKTEGDWSRFKVGVNWMISFPGLKNLAPPQKGMIRESEVEKIENDLQIGRAAIGRAISKAATRQMLDEVEAKIMEKVVRRIPGIRGKILWPKAGATKEEKSEFGEFYHKDIGWY